MLSRQGIFILSVLLAGNVQAQQSGFLNVSVGSSPTTTDIPQPVTLAGCNNTEINFETFWDTENQVVGNIPYGERISESGKPYFISKYYAISPPAWREADDHTDPFVGLVIPDRFQFQGDAPAQILYLDYRILKSTYLKSVPVDFTFELEELPSCADLGVSTIPINTSCEDFPWRMGAKGAAGIGKLSDVGKGSTAFLPFLDKEEKEPLQCNVTLLDDVMLHHEVFFAIDGELSKTIDITAVHQRDGTMELVCVPREPTDIPSGCSAP